MTTLFTTGGHRAPASVVVRERERKAITSVTWRAALVAVPGAVPPAASSDAWKAVTVVPLRQGEARIELLPDEGVTGEVVMWVQAEKDGIKQPFRPFNDTFTLR